MLLGGLMRSTRLCWMSIVLLGAVGHRAASGDPRPPFTGQQSVDVLVKAGYGRTYSPREFRPKLEVEMTGSGTNRTVTITDRQYAKPYSCTLHGKLDNDTLVFPPRQRCELEISTPDFCTLTLERCSARATGANCEPQDLGKVAAQLVAGRAKQNADGKWTLSLRYTADACVLAKGYNHDTPVLVQGGSITVGKP